MLLALAGREEVRALTAVCKRWAGVVWATPALWRELRIHAGAQLVAAPDDLARWAAAKGVLLRRAAPLLESLQLSTCEPAVPGGPTGEQCQLAAVHLAVLLSGLAPAVQLTRLELGAWGLALAPAHLRALAALPRLQQLTIQWPSSEQQLQVVLTTSPGRATLLSADGGHDLAAAVARMTGLQRLALPVASVPGPLVPAIAGLPQLSCLVLSSQQPLPAAVTSLAAAPALKELRLHEREERDDGGLPLPGAAARLSTLHVAAPSIEIGGGARVVSCWSPEEPAAVGLERSQCPCCGMSTCVLINACLERCAPVLDAVEAAGGGGGVMESLLLSHCHLGPAGLAPAPLTPAQQLTVSRTRRLEVLRCYSADLHAPLRLVLQQLPALQDLELRKVNVWYADLAGLLGAATALAGLTLLDCGLAGLPPGDYLAGLDSLSLAGNRFSAVPTSLLLAGSLGRLSLARNPLQLSLTDVAGVLARLPRLEVLHLGGCAGAVGAALERLEELGVEVAPDDDDEEEEAGAGDVASSGEEGEEGSSASDDDDGSELEEESEDEASSGEASSGEGSSEEEESAAE